jgi:hypothetical protein
MSQEIDENFACRPFNSRYSEKVQDNVSKKLSEEIIVSYKN